ncbi:MAG: hypothetical protein WB902_12305 [Acetobacteraceae bacterium]
MLSTPTSASLVLPQRADAPQVIAVEVKIDKGVLMKAMLDDSKSEYS